LLFTQEFYQLAKGRLTERGVFCVQAGCAAHTQNGTFAKVYNTLRQVFPHCFAYKVFVPFYSTEWGFVVCTVSEPGFAPVDVLPHEINHRLQYRHADGLKFYSGESHRMLFTLPPVIKRRLEREIHVIRDREPLREKFPGRTK
jgi:spermidine synthase